MDKKSGVRAFVLAAVVVGVIVLGALGAWMFLSGRLQPSTPPVLNPPSMAAPANPAAVPTPAPTGDPAADAAAHLQTQWDFITNDHVEQACLSQAKAAATASGYPSSVVSSCDCQAQESASQKSYQCQVSALDGQHPVSIDCTLSLQTCQISSQQGTATYTFDQLQALANS